MDKHSSEYNKLSKWVNGISMIPFGKYNELEVRENDSAKKIQDYINKSYSKLDNVLYGQHIVKNKNYVVISQWIINPLPHTNIIALEGPPGVGKLV